jgi:hypothetical protein
MRYVRVCMQKKVREGERQRQNKEEVERGRLTQRQIGRDRDTVINVLNQKKKITGGKQGTKEATSKADRGVKRWKKKRRHRSKILKQHEAEIETV